jgi:flagellar motor switch protein FliM
MQRQERQHDPMTAVLDARIPFTADLVRSKGVNLSQQLAILLPFAETMAEKVGVILSAFGGVPVKASVVSAMSEKIMPHIQAEAGFNIVLGTGIVSCWSQADPDFDKLMCEVCLGGSGGNGGDEANDRPATTFEKKLRVLINERVVRAAADALGDIGEHKGLELQPRARVAPRKAEGPLLCYKVRLLLNVFDDACEYDLYFSFDECLKLIGGISALANTSPSSASVLMEKTSFAVEVFLKPDVVDVRQILNLAPGEVLKLNVAASTPVELRLNGQRLSYGNLSFDNEGGKVRLIDEISPVQFTEVRHSNSFAAVQYGN